MPADSSVEGDSPAYKDEIEQEIEDEIERPYTASKENAEALSDSNTDKGEVKFENVPPEPSTSQVIENKSGPVSTNQQMLASIGALFDTKTKALSTDLTKKIDNNAKDMTKKSMIIQKK